MTTLTPVSIATADAIATPILQGFKDRYGLVPNFYSALGIDGATMKGYLAFEEAILEKPLLSERDQELISLAVANANGCHYCVSGHTFSGKQAGLSAEDCVRAQRGDASDPSERAVIVLALQSLKNKGHFSAEDLAFAKEHQMSPAKIVQILAWAAINTFSNWVNNLVQPKIDFPKVDLQIVE